MRILAMALGSSIIRHFLNTCLINVYYCIIDMRQYIYGRVGRLGFIKINICALCHQSLDNG